MMVLGFTPLVDPLFALYPGLSDYWLWLLLPLVVAISVVYKGTRVEHLGGLAREVVVMSVQVVFLMGVAAVGLYGLCWVWVRYL